jgi:glutaredoxin-related protein
MPYILVYTIHCPACNVLEKKLQQAGFLYSIVDDESEMQHIKQFPMMSVNAGPLMTFKEANQWIKENTRG